MKPPQSFVRIPLLGITDQFVIPRAPSHGNIGIKIPLFFKSIKKILIEIISHKECKSVINGM